MYPHPTIREALARLTAEENERHWRGWRSAGDLRVEKRPARGHHPEARQS